MVHTEAEVREVDGSPSKEASDGTEVDEPAKKKGMFGHDIRHKYSGKTDLKTVVEPADWFIKERKAKQHYFKNNQRKATNVKVICSHTAASTA
jgi:hypothetical protein